MSEQQLLALFSGILTNLLGEDPVDLTMATQRTDVPGWDSFQYINFIVAVETELGIKFRVADVESFATVGDIVTATQALVST